MTGRTPIGTAAGRADDLHATVGQPRARGGAAGRARRVDATGGSRDATVTGRTAAGGRTGSTRVTAAAGRSGSGDRASRADPGEFRTRGSAALAPARRVAPSPAVDAPPRLRVAPPAPVAVPRAPFVATVLLLVVVGVVGILVLNTKINENAFRLSRLQDQKSSLDAKEQNLSAQLSNVQSPGNLAAEAKRLGLVNAGSPVFIRLPDGRKLNIPQPASGR